MQVCDTACLFTVNEFALRCEKMFCLSKCQIKKRDFSVPKNLHTTRAPSKISLMLIPTLKDSSFWLRVHSVSSLNVKPRMFFLETNLLVVSLKSLISSGYCFSTDLTYSLQVFHKNDLSVVVCWGMCWNSSASTHLRECVDEYFLDSCSQVHNDLSLGNAS